MKDNNLIWILYINLKLLIIPDGIKLKMYKIKKFKWINWFQKCTSISCIKTFGKQHFRNNEKNWVLKQ